MLKLCFDNTEIIEALDLLQEELPILNDASATKVKIIWHDKKSVSIQQSDDVIEIYAKDKPHVFQALWQLVHNCELPCHWEYSFERNGLMLDNSRNAVASVSMVKRLLNKMAVMGHTWYMLYMEDTYEIPEQPYFGHARGRYSQAELKELDAYAQQLGIELVPCIQTLAHLNQFLDWEHEHNDYCDIDDILNIGRDSTKTLIKQMLQSLRACFTSNTIHLGMDEAYNLGRGTYLTEYGLKDKTEMMKSHLEYLIETCQEVGFEPMIWDDMFFSWYNQLDSNTDFKVPDGIELMYWDYYQTDKSHYLNRIETRGRITQKLHFAGGAWRWTGYVPHHYKTYYTTLPALAACKEKGIEKVIATAWGDDGSEAPFEVVMFGLVLYSYLDSHDEVDEAELSQWLTDYTGWSLEEWYWQAQFDLIPEMDIMTYLDVTPSKYLLYQDLLLPRFMNEIKAMPVEYTEHLKQLKQSFETSSQGVPYINEFYAAYADALITKWQLPYQIRAAYHEDDYATLKRIVEEDLPRLKDKITVLAKKRQNVWLKESNPMGMEILDHRFGGMLLRIDVTQQRLQDYIAGKITVIEELELPILDGAPQAINENQPMAIHYNRTQRIFSRSRFTW